MTLPSWTKTELVSASLSGCISVIWVAKSEFELDPRTEPSPPPPPQAEINAGSNHHWKRGVFVAIFNPLQIPFWLVWGVYVFENGWLQKNISGIALFAFCCSIGTISVLYFYAMAGKKMVEKLNITRTSLSRFVGVVMLLLAAYQTYHTLHA